MAKKRYAISCTVYPTCTYSTYAILFKNVRRNRDIFSLALSNIEWVSDCCLTPTKQLNGHIWISVVLMCRKRTLIHLTVPWKFFNKIIFARLSIQIMLSIYQCMLSAVLYTLHVPTVPTLFYSRMFVETEIFDNAPEWWWHVCPWTVHVVSVKWRVLV
jgi:hypothetical protein